MEEVGLQLAPPIFVLQNISTPFRDAHPMPKKRAFPYQSTNFHHHNQHHSQPFQNNRDNWNPMSWDWDSVAFLSKPSDVERNQRKDESSTATPSTCKSNTLKVVEEEDESLQLNLRCSFSSSSAEEPVSKPNKRVRCGSPGGSTFPTCQVDDCNENLSTAKDYHRRHKVCQVHSKSTRALVAKQMQRFCQQCSRFHPLSEFDEGKRSCRRRLAGHNRRRRKAQPEDVTSRVALQGNGESSSCGNLDIVNLLAAVARAQGKAEDKSVNPSSSQDCDQLVQILRKMNSLPLPVDLSEKFPNLESLNRKALEQNLSQHKTILSVNKSPSTVDLLPVLSATLAASSKDTLALLSQRSSHSCDSLKTKSTCPYQATVPDLQKRSLEFPSVGGESSTSYHSSKEDSDAQIQETQVNLPLRLFSSPPEKDGQQILGSSRKYLSSGSSNPIEECSPSSSPPVVQELFPMQSTIEAVPSEKMLFRREIKGNVEAGRTPDSSTPFDLFRCSNRGPEIGSFQSSPYQPGYTSSGSDNSPSSLNSDIQDRTGQIIFKLFDKDPSHFPVTLRTQIYNWLSNSPSEMESYIRPGCVVLSIYVSMSSTAWDQLEENFLQRVKSLVQSSDSDFWRSGRFLVYTGRRLASHKDGNIRLCKSWRTVNSPELILVSPFAVVAGQQTSFLLKGRNLTSPGTKIHCTFMGGYFSKEVKQWNLRRTIHDEVDLGSLRIEGPSCIGRCFIEVENGFKGSCFPVIIADSTICEELRLLESVFDMKAEVSNVVSEGHINESVRTKSTDEMLHFLNELGWLFQRIRLTSITKGPVYPLRRFKFLLTFSVERDCCALVKTVLEILIDRTLESDGLSTLEIISDIQLLHRAVKRRCRKMVDLLVHYFIISKDDAAKKYVFPPNLVSPGGVTPLHLAASMSGSYDIIDALTSDPQEIGLRCWNSVLDANGQSPYAYAAVRNNHSYNQLVARKLADKRNDQFSVIIGNVIEQSRFSMEQELGLSAHVAQKHGSCAKCAVVAAKYKKTSRSKGLLQWPYVHSILAVAAVCVCVCLFFRGSPDIGLIAPFKWENLGYGTI